MFLRKPTKPITIFIAKFWNSDISTVFVNLGVLKNIVTVSVNVSIRENISTVSEVSETA